jgi:hypothetical protein
MVASLDEKMGVDGRHEPESNQDVHVREGEHGQIKFYQTKLS